MGPSYDNGFGSFGSGGTTPGGMVVGGAPAPEKKSKKGLVIGLIVIVIMIVVGALAVLAIQNSTKSKGQSGSDSSNEAVGLKGTFNSYLNYVLFGKNSNLDVEQEELKSIDPYFTTIMNDEEKLKEYLSEADKKFNDFSKAYQESGKNPAALGKLSDYFQDFARIVPLTVSDIVSYYYSSGVKMTDKLINKKYAVTGISGDLITYVKAEKSMAKTVLNILEDASGAKCRVDENLKSDCYTVPDDKMREFNDEYAATLQLASHIRSEATNTVVDLYNLIYETGWDAGRLK